ncbi:hypothetical protein DdX_19317 [Ditylenchus destructor]|uniref:F-box domain-containing protein n=1 Tax=Ditylenchus destructor TaxID=166010 RepID=A0AAD4MHX5_9BILA|nr:hypothetical protein DdX_19317 [Ditylenchus destructor]
MFGDIAALPMGVPMPVAEIQEIPVEAKNMHKSDQLGDELPNSENEEGPEAKKSRSNYRIPNKATMDNDIMMETLTHLNYHQLAKSCLVSKRFWNMIRAHRHKLALLYVDCIEMGCIRFNLPILEIFDKELCPEEYNEWVIRNRYSKQIPLNGQDAEKNCTRNEGEIYNLRVLAGKGLKGKAF